MKKPRGGFTPASPVKVTRSDGTVEVRPAYSPKELRRVKKEDAVVYVGRAYYR